MHAVDGVSFDLRPGEILGIVGESGSGKSASPPMTLMGLTRSPNASISGSVRLHGTDLLAATDEELHRIRGRRDLDDLPGPDDLAQPRLPGRATQIVEQIEAHRDVPDDEAQGARGRAARRSVGIPNAKERFDDYPHEFSGGMRQRAMIAMAPRPRAADPDRRRADHRPRRDDPGADHEADRQLNEERGLAVILITHDLGVIADIADRVLVMYAGRIVEQGTLDEIFYDPQHPYTWGLLGSLTRLDQPPPDRLPQIGGQPPRCSRRRPVAASARAARTPSRSARAAGLEGRPGERSRRSLLADPQEGTASGGQAPRQALPDQGGAPDRPRGAAVHAVDDVSLTLHEGETLGLVGESGCGKSTLCPRDHPAARADRRGRCRFWARSSSASRASSCSRSGATSR